MKCRNEFAQVISVVLPDGRAVELRKGDSVDMPEWLFRTLSDVFPGLKAVKEAPVKISGEPVKINEVKVAKDDSVKNGKAKKSGK